MSGIGFAEIGPDRDVADIQQTAGRALADEGKHHAMVDLRHATQHAHKHLRKRLPADGKNSPCDILLNRTLESPVSLHRRLQIRYFPEPYQ